jgi:hypothetical protein
MRTCACGETRPEKFPKTAGSCTPCRGRQARLRYQRRTRAAAGLTIREVICASYSRDAVWCECGRPKALGSEGCDRCMILDGHTANEAAVIGALRMRGAADASELAQEIGKTRDVARLAARKLVRAGRAVVVEREILTEQGNAFGQKKSVMSAQVVKFYELQEAA